MRAELDAVLCEQFPHVFADRNGDKTQTAMCWGFECGDGWYSLLFDCAAKIEKLILELPEDQREHYRAVQVKEKFGTLRFYMRGETQDMSDVIRIAEDKSAETCEQCGKPGEVRPGGWISTQCDDCHLSGVLRHVKSICLSHAKSGTRTRYNGEVVPAIVYENEAEIDERMTKYLNQQFHGAAFRGWPEEGNRVLTYFKEIGWALAAIAKAPRKRWPYRYLKEKIIGYKPARLYRRLRRLAIDFIREG